MNEKELKVYPFEYNESDGNFHQNFGDYEQNTNGYKTICEVHENMWDPFSSWIRKRYNFADDVPPSFEKVKEEWDLYCGLREHIICSYDKDEYITFMQRLLFEKERTIQILMER